MSALDETTTGDELRATTVGTERTVFDRMADSATKLVSRGGFFSLCCAIIAGWLVTGPIFNFTDTWQLVVQSMTTVVTFLLVALLQNEQTRNNIATQAKLNALAEAMAAQMEADPARALDDAVHELRVAVGIEARVGT